MSRKSSPVTRAAALLQRPKAKRSPKPVTLGRRVGTKRSDTRWEAPDGTIWASKFEYEVFDRLRGTVNVRRTVEGADTFKYATHLRQGVCHACGSPNVGQERAYTPDLLVTPQHGGAGFYVDVKGYIRKERRSLLRAFVLERPDVPLRLIVQRDYPVSAKASLVEWAGKYLKIPVHVWNGDIPEGWK